MNTDADKWPTSDEEMVIFWTLILRDDVEMRRTIFTLEEEQKMVRYVLGKMRRATTFGLKGSKMATVEAWNELAGKEGVTKLMMIMESHFRKTLRAKLHSLEYLTPEERLMIGKMMGIAMTEDTRFVMEYKMHIRLKRGMIEKYDATGAPKAT